MASCDASPNSMQNVRPRGEQKLAQITESIKNLRLTNQLQLKDEEQKEILEWIESGRTGKLEILITGRAGVGKSTLVNALMGRPVAGVGNELQPHTREVIGHVVTTEEGLEIVVWDSPGLQDGSEDEAKYLEEMKEKCCDIDIVMYCIKLSTTRGEDQDELDSINKLTDKFGVKLWDHSIIVLTQANTLGSLLSVNSDCEERFKKRIKEWRERIRNVLYDAGVPKDIVMEIPIEVAGHVRKPHLPGDRYWLSTVWLQFLNAAKEQAMPKITALNAHRLVTEKEVKPEDVTSGKAHEVPLVMTEEKMKEYAEPTYQPTSSGAETGTINAAVEGVVEPIVGFVKVASKLIVKLWRRFRK